MSVKLVSVSKPLIDNINTPEELIVYCARVSNPSNQVNKESSPKLLQYLIKHAHWSPFEMCSMCVEIKTSRAIAAQILRHRSFSFQEFSQRYSTATSFEPLEFRQQGKTNRQVGDSVIPLPTWILDKVNTAQESAKYTYKLLIDHGVAKECARMILPLNTQTTLYMSGTIRSWIHFLQIRATQDTQKEHREIAEKIKQLFIKEFPITSEALGYTNANISPIPKL
jgi:thymidylate synthase (FAD)